MITRTEPTSILLLRRIQRTAQVERGEKIPSLETFVALLNLLHVSADMVLTDVVDTGYTVKQSMLAEQVGRLPAAERERIYAVVQVLVDRADTGGS